MTNLKTFGLINNKLESLSKELSEMVLLRDLRIEGQNLDSFPDFL
jgi:Leucine-rich repeat (LRR) protein